MGSEAAPGTGDGRQLAYARRGQTRHGGWLDWRCNLRLLLGCVLAAVCGALPVIWCVILEQPWLAMGAGLGQGVIVGIVLLLAFRRLRVHHVPIAITAGILAALLSFIMVYAGLWIDQVYLLAKTLQLAGSQYLLLLGVGFTWPYRALDAIYLVPTTGHRGLVGYFITRIMLGQTVAGMILVHALATGLLAPLVSYFQLKQPFCRGCGAYLPDESTNATVVPRDRGHELAFAISSADVGAVLGIVREAAQAELGHGCAVARLRSCGECRVNFVDVIIKIYNEAGVSQQTILQPMEIGEQMATALRAEAAMPLETEDGLGAGEDAKEASTEGDAGA